MSIRSWRVNLISLNVYNPAGSFLKSYTTDQVYNITQIANGLGGSGIVFKLDSTQAADLDTLFGATTGVERFTLNATFSNVSGGPDAIEVGAITAAIPKASTWAMMALGFMGVGFMLTDVGINQASLGIIYAALERPPSGGRSLKCERFPFGIRGEPSSLELSNSGRLRCPNSEQLRNCG